jgi:hypothetical protein
MVEIWKDIIEYENLYQISNFGNVRNKRFLQILKQGINRSGYFEIYLSKNSKQKTLKIHRLVALHFIDNLRNLEFVNHIDGNKLNNHYSNLEWVSRRENNCHRFINIKTLSKFRGVSKANRGKPWRATITINKIQKYLGQFNTEEEAYQARINFEKENNIINKYV